MKQPWPLAAAFVGALLACGTATAEPYLAVHTGFKCRQCHVDPAGGGKRNVYGSAYAVNELAARIVGDGSESWNGEINRWFAVGADLRAGLDYVDTPGSGSQSELGISRATLYAELRAVPGLLTLYADEQVAPGGALARQAFALLTPGAGRYTIKVGKFFLPFGWRLEDDSAFIRQATGINMTTPDNGVEVGFDGDRWSTQLALTNGTAGASENDSGKQWTARTAYVRPRWRIGASASFNNAALGDREMLGVFAGARTGPISWLVEWDAIRDEVPTAPGGELDGSVSLIEGNWQFGKGHNLKVSYDYYDPRDDADDDERERLSIVWEYSPLEFLQARIGARRYDGVDAIPATNRDEIFAELHAYF